MNALRERWLALAPNVRGALWLLAACLVFSIMGALIKLLGTHLPSHQSAFFRALFGNLAVLPFALHLGRAGFATKRLPLHLSRGLTGAGAMLCGFYATVHLPLAESVALSFTKPLWLIPLAVLILGEPVRARRWTATAVGFVGVLVMLRPGGASIDPAVGVALLGALLVALVNIQVKKLVSTEAPATLVFYSTAVATVVTAVPAAYVWVAPTWGEIGMLVAIGACGTIGQSLGVRALKIGEATAVMPYDYSRLIFSGIFGYALFGDVPDFWGVIGALIIVGATLYIARREAALGNPPPTPSGVG